MGYRQDLFKPPNLVSMVRLFMAPVLLYLALRQQPGLYLGAVCFTVFTDLADGFLARTLHQITPLGSLLDSWGDFTVYFTMAVCSWILWPATVVEHLSAWVVIVLSFTLPPLIGLIKFGSVTSYHTWSVKLAVAVTLISYVLLFADVLHWPIDVAAFFCTLAAIEEITITLLLKQKRSDVRGLWKIFK
ncbi:CDP-alcohol phosphatidyltransferase family protein [Aestuariicella hydrocarbonica]|uniref:CDP-alcohol phosphatidyltransferase family protein n=1 Tax=Pseudomaricurvus hydrocarbonicus TaxID=1470433 RepID=A0A9E5JWV2_9GAMM|nr:CDP-alcohol phosphatidyltransferase family protein [Aestuariicella hydrocarbonica]NHO65985.1 CDP-alcohol phosphatidyltransferase family protein [Aestuariicella hydrocarbonica]